MIAHQRQDFLRTVQKCARNPMDILSVPKHIRGVHAFYRMVFKQMAACNSEEFIRRLMLLFQVIHRIRDELSSQTVTQVSGRPTVLCASIGEENKTNTNHYVQQDL